ncbi:MAG TPA: hypothetical protein VI612_04210 [Candidatus Nanoarchaeia archaeon]|nr:hypothetical protein [Candidatus Nanoarchaeia archaeon]
MKAQITMFIIIGIMIVMAFGIALYVGGKMQRLESTPSQLALEKLGVQPVYDYVVTCLVLAANDAFDLLGKQGGVLYKEQGGVNDEGIEGVNYLSYADVNYPEKLKVRFAVIPPSGTVCQDVTKLETCSFFSESPDYPFNGFPFADGQTLFFGYYGENTLPPLYKGTNPDTGQPVLGSVQETLESFIAKRTTECADFNSFKDRFSFSTGNAVASLIFANETYQFAGEQNVNVELSWPVEVTTAGGKVVLNSFAAKLPVRPATVYYFVKSIVDGDVTDVSFKAKNFNAFSVETVPLGDNSLVIVKDAQSVVKSRPFEFWVARRNRIPALWNIDTAPLSDVKFHITGEGRGARINVVRLDDENSQLEINDPCPDGQNPYVIKLRASDPDEDPVTFDVHVPGSLNNEIPSDALGQAFAIAVFAKDKSISDNWDSQSVPLQVVLCPQS